MTITEIQNLSDEELRVRCAEMCGLQTRYFKFWYQHEEGSDSVTGIKTRGEAEDERKSLDGEPIEEYTALGLIPNYPADLNACLEFESILLSEPEPEKGQIGRPSSHLEAYQYALCALEPDKPLWHKSARTKAVAFVFAMQE
jgi:hypothetical protein